MNLPIAAGAFLLSLCSENDLERYCDILYEEIKNIRESHMPEKSIWETWLFLDKSWAQNLNAIYSNKKIGDEYHYYMEHRMNLKFSKMLHKMYLRTAKNYAEITEVTIKNDKIALKIKPKKS